ncbi:hypothetical protein ACKS0A_06014 [Histoplasma ohiense]
MSQKQKRGNQRCMEIQTHQSVTASSHRRISCSLVPPKWSTNASPKTSLATLPSRRKTATASFRFLANRTPWSFGQPTSAPRGSGGTGRASFFSTPRQPSARIAART